jgi:hypothetical protein
MKETGIYVETKKAGTLYTYYKYRTKNVHVLLYVETEDLLETA